MRYKRVSFYPFRGFVDFGFIDFCSNTFVDIHGQGRGTLPFWALRLRECRLEREYEVRSYQPGDEEKIICLLELVWGGWPKFDIGCSPVEHWRWKYQNNPLRMNQISVGVSDNMIIGCNHSLYLKIKIGNRICVSTQGGDATVHSDFRRMAIFRKMRDLDIKIRKESGVQLHYCSTGNPILAKGSSKFYHRFPHTVIRLFRIHDVGLHLRKRPIKYALIYKYGVHLVKLANRCRNAFRLYSLSSYEFRIRKIAHFDERIEVFWEEIKDHYNFIVERSRDYLNWRYCDPRGGGYLVKTAEADSKILGYIVLRINSYQKDYPRGFIVDLLTLPNRLDVANALVANAVNYFEGYNINIIICLIIKNHPYEAILKKSGFITDVKKVSLFYKEYTEIEDLKKLETGSPSGIHFVYGDFDLI